MDKDDLNITVEYNTPRKTNLYINVKPSEMDLERRHRRRMYGRRRRRRYVDYDECGECEESRNRYNRESDCGYEMVEEMQYYDCCDEIEEIFNDVTESGIIEYTFSDLCFEPSEVIVFLSRTGWNPCLHNRLFQIFRNVLYCVPHQLQQAPMIVIHHILMTFK